MLRIWFRRQCKLDRSDDLTRIARYEKHTSALSYFLKDRPPIVLRILCVQGRQKANRGSTRDSILQQMDQLRENDRFLFWRNAFDGGYE